ncbi:MAG: NACHT domain-containing protein [Symplocastrum torsivum CPER-KK1]|jgi:energy-coupling factor transporter ATP-binding protein EcfA2|uniref:NACHT domain-containing protein n=1 Tax=Symplocastrum torsivum CPER-KK1 TaxID=450513 RepID=A0A951PN09_9CYAN|nr:NACHT domain-containing protein [Symplocastrum torsivum CPER-KK1]
MKQDNRDNSKNWQTTNTGGTNYVGEIHFHGNEQNSPLTQQEYRNRQALLTKVKNFWVKGVLEKSLYNQVLLELGLEERLDAVANPWSVVLEIEESLHQPLPDGAKVIDIFEQIGEGRTLLILGEPGAGKTTTLLELACNLIARAEQDVNHLIPVIFNLSSWANKRQKIADWLIEELNTKYQVPKKIGQHWVNQQQLLLLLDGLDEVQAEHRNQCVSQINAFHQEYSPEIIVCSRMKDYENLSNRLNFQGAVYVRSLTKEQVYHYLASLSADLVGLRALLERDMVLQELAKSPLMLNIMVIAYQGIAVKDLPKIDLAEERRLQLFDAYVERMFKRRLVSQHYSKAQVMRWLTWLAKRMKQKSQTIFLIERMQPSWLQNKNQKIKYRIGTALIAGLSFGLSFGLLGQLIFGIRDVWQSGLLYRLIDRLIDGLIIGIVDALVVALALILGLVREKIKTVETLKWSWRKARNGLLCWMILGFTLGLIAGLTIELIDKFFFRTELEQIAKPGLVEIVRLFDGVLGLIAGLTYGLTNGLGGSEIETKTIPNQAIWMSAMSAKIFGLVGGLIGGIVGGLSSGLVGDLTVGIIDGLIIGLVVGLIGGGGLACIKHFTLRLILYFNNYIPWNYACFLDYAAERIFLQKVGGGYIFTHRMLMEHFAQMELEVERKSS